MAGFEAMFAELATTRARYEDRGTLGLSWSERARLQAHLHELRAGIAGARLSQPGVG